MNMPAIITTLGLKQASDLGIILPHEHIFANFDSLDHAGAYAVTPETVLDHIGPSLRSAQAAGVTLLVDATSIGGARRADILRAVSVALGLPVVVATGIFREPWIAQWAGQQGEDGLRAWMEQEITTGIEDSGVRAGWIKLRSGDDELSPAQVVLVLAAARVGAATGVVIGSHTVAGRVAARQVDVIEDAGYAAGRFIWIHAQVEPDFAWNLELARRGAWIEYDGIGDSPADAVYVDRILRMWDAGYGDRVLLSQDRGWYDPVKPGGGVPKPYTYLADTFLPKLAAAGLSDRQIRQMTVHNPFNAYATDHAVWY
jgi:phosphotriesterase-related protein